MTQALSVIAWALLGGATLVAQDDAVRIEPMPGPLLRDWDASAPDCAMAIRVVDAITHAGIAGAVLYSVPEHDRPRGGEFWFTWRAEADAFGFLRVPPHARGWFVHRAPGHGIASQSSSPIEETYGDHVQHLYPALQWRLALCDPFERPIAHAEVGYCVGCGHTPDVQVAHSDENGIVTITDCDPTFESVGSGNDIYVRSEGVSPEYDSERWRLGDPPTRVRREFARTVRGTVLAPDGKPFAGAIVRSDYGLHRGPYSWTDAAGAFVAWGGSDCTIEVGTEQFDARFPAIADEFVVQLPASKHPAAGPLAELAVRVVDAATGAPFAGASVEAWSVGVQAEPPDDAVGDEATETEDESEPVAGEFRFRLPIGPVGVQVAANQVDDAWTVYEPVRFDMHLPAGTTERVVRVARRPTLRVTAAADTQVTLRTRRDGFSELDLSDAIAEGRPIPVPAHEPFALIAYPRSADSSGLGRFHVFPSPPQQSVHIEPWRPTRLLVQVLDGERMPVPARLTLSTSHDDFRLEAPSDETAEEEDPEAVDAAPPAPANESPSGWHELHTWLVGCAWLFVEPLDATHRPFAVHLGLPELGVERVVDLGILHPPTLAAPSVRVLDKDGAPFTGELEILRPGLGVHGELAADGGWNGMVPSAGDRLTATSDRRDDDDKDDVPHGSAPLTTRLVGNGPWVLREGRGTVRFEATDDLGMALDQGTLLFGLREYRVEHVFELRSVPAGEHEFFLAANGCDGARIRVRLADGEQRVVPIVLRRTPR